MKPFNRHERPLFSDPPGRHREGTKEARLTCLLTPLPKGKELSLALVHYLSDEIRDVRFTLDPRERADAVWVCGYGRRAAAFLSKLRSLHPAATIVVTGGEPTEGWASSVIDAGADYACSWPVDYSLLDRILHKKHVPETNRTGHGLDGWPGEPAPFLPVGW